MALICGTAVLVSAFVTGCAMDGGPGAIPTPVVTATSIDAAAYAVAVVQATNAVRAAHGLALFESSVCAAEQGLARARDLVDAEELEHAPLEPVIQACPPATTAAENLGRGVVTAERMVEAWMGSTGHRANLLDPELTAVGVGCVPVGDGGMLCSQVFLAEAP